MPDIDDIWDDEEDRELFAAILEGRGSASNGPNRPPERLIAADPTLAADTLALLDEIERLTEANNRLHYVLDGVAGAVDTGRNEPLHIWREQIEIARAALAEGGPDDR